jgi:hypothetical protein
MKQVVTELQHNMFGNLRGVERIARRPIIRDIVVTASVETKHCS